MGYTDVVKDEFETDYEFKQRRNAYYERVFGAGKKILLRLPIFESRISYDINTHTLTFDPLPYTVHGSNTDHYAETIIDSVILSQENYAASNAFGAYRQVKKTKELDSIVSIRGDLIPYRDGKISISIDPIRAKAMKLSSEIVIFGRLDDPYFGATRYHESPKIDWPYDDTTIVQYFFINPRCIFIASSDTFVADIVSD